MRARPTSLSPLSAPWLLRIAIVAYAAGFSALSILRQRAFATGRFDLGNMVQAVWATAHGHPLRVTDLHGDQFVRLGAHVEPILVLLAPLWWLWPSPDLLLTVQATAIALGALPVYRLARRRLGTRSALGFGLAYLLLPAVQWLTLNEFHPGALAVPLLLFAFDYLDEDRLGSFAVCALLAAACREEIGVVVAGFGLWYALSRGRLAAGAAIAVLGAAWTGVAAGVVIPHFAPPGGSGFESRYSELGGSPGAVARTVVAHPLRALAGALDARGVQYLLELGLPLALLWVAAPLVLVATLPALVVNLLSATPTQTSIHFHYTAAILPPLVVASVLGAGRVARARPGLTVPLGVVAVAVALGSNYALGAIPLWRTLPGGESYGAYAAEVTAHDRAAARALAVIPGSAVVAATNSLGAHLSARRRVLSFPFVQDATWIAADETSPGYSDRLAPLPTAVQLAALRRNPAWRLVFEEDGVLVFRRVPT